MSRVPKRIWMGFSRSHWLTMLVEYYGILACRGKHLLKRKEFLGDRAVSFLKAHQSFIAVTACVSYHYLFVVPSRSQIEFESVGPIVCFFCTLLTFKLSPSYPSSRLLKVILSMNVCDCTLIRRHDSSYEGSISNFLHKISRAFFPSL